MSWRDEFYKKLKKRNVKIDPYLKIQEDNPKKDSEDAEAKGLRGNLHDLQLRYQNASDRNKRKIRLITLFSIFLLLCVIALCVALGITMGNDFSAGDTCATTSFAIQSMDELNDFTQKDCSKTAETRIGNFTLDSNTTVASLKSTGLLDITNLTGEFSLKFADLQSIDSMTVENTQLVEIDLPVLTTSKSLLLISNNVNLREMEFPSLNKVNELVFNNSRMLKINCPSLTTMTDLVLQNSDIGEVGMSLLTTIFSLRITDVGGYSSSGAIRATFDLVKQEDETDTISSSGFIDGRIPLEECDERCEFIQVNINTPTFNPGNPNAPTLPSNIVAESSEARPPPPGATGGDPPTGTRPPPPGVTGADSLTGPIGNTPRPKQPISGMPPPPTAAIPPKIQQRRDVNITATVTSEASNQPITVTSTVTSFVTITPTNNGFNRPPPPPRGTNVLPPRISGRPKPGDSNYGPGPGQNVGPPGFGPPNFGPNGPNGPNGPRPNFGPNGNNGPNFGPNGPGGPKPKPNGNGNGNGPIVNGPNQMVDQNGSDQNIAFEQAPGDTNTPPNNKPGAGDPDPTKLQRNTTEEFRDLNIIMSNVTTIDTIAIARTVNMSQIYLPNVKKVRELTIQASSFNDAEIGQNIFFPALQVVSVMSIYQVDNIGTFRLPLVNSIDYLTIESNKNLTLLDFGQLFRTDHDGLNGYGYQAANEYGVPGQIYDFQCSLNRDLEEMTMGFIQHALQTINVVFNTKLQYFRIPKLESVGSMVIMQNPAMAVFNPQHLFKGDVLLSGNPSLTGALSFPELVTTSAIAVKNCNYTSLTMPLLQQIEKNSSSTLDNPFWATIRTANVDSGYDTQYSLYVEDTPMTEISIPSMKYAESLFLVRNEALSTLNVSSLIFVPGIFLISSSEIVQLELPQLYFATQISLSRNLVLETVSFPGLEGWAGMVIESNPELTTVSCPDINTVSDKNYFANFKNNDKFCLTTGLSSMLGNITEGVCELSSKMISAPCQNTTSQLTAENSQNICYYLSDDTSSTP